MASTVIKSTDAGYPAPLRELHNPVKQLYVEGRLPTTEHWVAIVGSRRATAYGKDVARHIAGELARRGMVIVSGLAIGIDTTAHTAALEAGGLTVAVLGGGLSNRSSYPFGNYQLAQKIIESQGAIISEYAPEVPPIAGQFPARNRIIAGLSEVTIVAEAALSSGSLITATMALELGREVMAVPGNINQPGSAGCNNLIKAGAHPLTDVSDVLHVLDIYEDSPATQRLPADDFERQVYETIVDGVQDTDQLLARLKCDMAKLSMALTSLELSGFVRSMGGGAWIAA